MYPQGHHNQEMTQQTLNNEPIMRFPSNTSPKLGMVKWSPNFEPIFLPIPPGGRSVPATPEDEQTHSFELNKPNTSTFNPNTSHIQQGIVHLSDESNTNYGIANEKMARTCQDKKNCKNFKLLVAQEIVKFNPNVEGPKSKDQTNTKIKNTQPMINFNLDK